MAQPGCRSYICLMQTFLKSGRRDFLGKLSLAGALGFIAQSPLGAYGTKISELAAYPAEGHVFLSAPYLQAPSTDRISIRFITNRYCYSWVEYGTSEQLGNKAHEITDGLVDAFNRINNIELQDLKPGTRYYYRVFSREIVEFLPYKLTYGETIQSDIYSFVTFKEKPDSVNWLVLNDIHDRPASFGHLMGLHQQQPMDYVLLNGDIFDYQTDEQQLIDHLISPVTASFAKSCPFLFLRGNHETRGKFARGIKDYFSNPSPGQYFAFRHGPVFTIALDTGEDKPDDHPVYAGIVDFDQYRRTQGKWLEKQLQSEASKSAPFRVVMMHIPPQYSGDWHGPTHVKEVFSPLFDKYGVDMVISGHTHRHSVNPPVAGVHNYPVIIGGGPKEGQRTLIRVKASTRSLDLQMLDDSGKEVGVYRVPAKK